MVDALIGAFAWTAAIGSGMRALRLAGFHPSRAEKWTYGSALGLGGLAYLVFVFGSFGYLSRPFWTLVLMALFVPAAFEIAHSSELPGKDWKHSAWLRAAGALAFFAMLGSLFGALAPATGQDELTYHLAQPANYLREGRVYEVPFSTNALWPYLMQMLFTLGLVLQNEGVSKFFHWAMTWTAAGAVYCFVRRLGGHREEAGWGFLIYLLAPAVLVQSSFAYVDSALAAYVVLSMLALVTALGKSSARWAALAGIFAGLAASVKLLGLFAVLLGAGALAAGFRKAQRKGPAIAALFFACAALAGGTWYLRAWILRGNPVFPFYPEWFGGHGWRDWTYVNTHGRPGLLGFFTFPWDLTMVPAWFGGEAAGPLFLMFAPAAFLLAPPARVKIAAAFGLAYSALWFAIDPNVRFFFPALGFFAVPAAFAVSRLASGRGAAAFFCRAAAFGVLASSAALSAYHFYDEAALALRGGRDSYLRRHERSFAVAQEVNTRLKPGDRILSVGEVRGFAFNLKRSFVLEEDFENMTRYSTDAPGAEGVVRFWRDKGFTHVLWSDRAAERADKLRASSLLADPALRRKFFEETLVVRSGGVRYVLYKILK